MRRVALTAVALLIAACGTARETTASTPTVKQTGPAHSTITQGVIDTLPPRLPPKTVIDTHGLWVQVIDNDGTYLVGTDVFPGKYRNAGGTPCHWARLRSLDPDDIIDSGTSSNPQMIQILLSDTAFLTRNCGTWQWISLF